MTDPVSRDSLAGTALSPTHIGEAAADTMIAFLNNAANVNAAVTAAQLDADQLPIWKKIAVGPGTSAEVDSGWDLPANAIVEDVFVEVVTAEATGATKTLDVGLLASESGGDADGFLDGVSVAAVGAIRGKATVTAGVFASTTRGVLLAAFTAGTNADDRGLFQEQKHSAGAVTAKSVSYSRGGTLTEFAGYIWIKYSVLAGALG